MIVLRGLREALQLQEVRFIDRRPASTGARKIGIIHDSLVVRGERVTNGKGGKRRFRALAKGRIAVAPGRCYQLRTRVQTSARARVPRSGACTLGGGRRRGRASDSA
eukprot:1397164-Pleurochrysis_carterae.AAC.2